MEKILEPDERLRDWPVEGTTGYEFANDVTALFANPDAEEPFSAWWEELCGERRSFAEVAHEAKVELARGDLAREFAYLRRFVDDPWLEEAAASLPVYRTYVEPWSGRVAEEDREALAGLPENLRKILLLEERGHDEFVTRFQQTTGPVMAKGGRGHGSLPLAQAERAQRGGWESRPVLALGRRVPPGEPRAGQAVSAAPARHADARHEAERGRASPHRGADLAGGRVVRATARATCLTGPVEDELLWQTLVGAWPVSRERLQAYLVERCARRG